LRLTEKRFSATQYALFSSLFALPRVLAGPITGFAVAALGWSTFFIATLVVGVPGLLMLNRFVPFGVREPEFDDPAEGATPSQVGALVRPGLVSAVALAVGATALLAVLDAMERMRTEPTAPFDVWTAVRRISHPADVGGWVQVVGIAAFAIVGALFMTAVYARRRVT